MVMTTCRAPMCELVAGLALAGGAACGGPQVGPCTLLYDDPLFVIAAATDARSGAPVPRLVFRDFSYKGAPVTDLTFLTRNTGAPPRNVSISDGEVVCDVACAFGASQVCTSSPHARPGTGIQRSRSTRSMRAAAATAQLGFPAAWSFG